MTFSLGIDIGTSGVKTATLNAEYEIFSTSNIKHIKQNSDKINPSYWWETVKHAIKLNLINLNKIEFKIFLLKDFSTQTSLSFFVQISSVFLHP